MNRYPSLYAPFFVVLILCFATKAQALPKKCKVKVTTDQIALAEFYSGLGTIKSVHLSGRLIQTNSNFDPSKAVARDFISQTEIKKKPIQLYLLSKSQTVFLGKVKTDSEGYVNKRFSLSKMSPGDYQLQIGYKGCIVGMASVRLLALNHREPVVRSDIDLTYLQTDFQTKAAMLKLLNTPASKKKALPAMEIVYKALRKGKNNANRPLRFLSGSPRFFKRVLENKMHIDHVQQDGLTLKPFKNIVYQNILTMRMNFIATDLKEQVGYKLDALLRLRLDIPTTTPEILMGDDSEADIAVYNLYHRFVSHQLTKKQLRKELKRLGVAARWQKSINKLAKKVRKKLPQPMPVQAIYINQTGKHSGSYPIKKWSIPKRTRYHQGALPLILDLYEQNWVDWKSVKQVQKRLLTLGQSEKQMLESVKKGIKSKFIQQKTMDQLGLTNKPKEQNTP